ncbi:hypothetical protein B0J13DRAFT_17942 [Dactylonectria estremocensis]|uniref:Uncharacterized protein n=1 Tax=Dactylonectria estremocensis TaxID=1079267 RepID=A0A9P9JEL9_9HYPO|nr:hypothetical protein B0J13DRAFT_17942 [Dactylonectria estremocensis]
MTPKEIKSEPKVPRSEAMGQKRPNTLPVPARRKVRRPTEIVTSEGTYIPSDNDAEGPVLSDDDDVESIDLSEDESDGSEEEDEDENNDDDDDDDDDDDSEDDDSDDTDSVYLSDSDELEEINTGIVSQIPARAIRSRSSRNTSTSARPGNQNVLQSNSTLIQTQTETTHWMVTQRQTHQASSQAATITRGGTSTTRQQIIHRQSPRPSTVAGQGRDLSRGNSLRLNMSLNVDIQFSGLVTGRNISMAGVSRPSV